MSVQQIAAVQPTVRYENGAVIGLIPWPADGFFRPTLGLFVDDRLVTTVRTFRSPAATKGQDHPEFRFQIDGDSRFDGIQLSRIVASCLETGQPIDWATTSTASPSRAPSTPVTIEQIMATGERRVGTEVGGGFKDFLLLPIIDQIEILYMDILGRRADPSGAQSRAQGVARGELDVLEIRDQLIESDEFRSRADLRKDQAVGGWCTWAGLTDTVPHVVIPADARSGEFGRYMDVVAAQTKVSDHLGWLVLGRGVASVELERWCRANIGPIRSLDYLVKKPDGDRSQSVADLLLRDGSLDLMPRVTVGAAGRRDGGVVRQQGGSGGHLVFGPFVELSARSYRVVAHLRVLSGNGSLSLDVVADGVLFARSDVDVRDEGSYRIVVDFTIPTEFAELLSDAKFETRVGAAGACDVALEALSLERLDGEGPLYPALGDWLPLLTVGGSGKRVDLATVQSGVGERSGHLLYGPYLKLLPGLYCISAEASFPSGGRRRETVTIDVAENATPIAVRHVKDIGRGCTVRLPFIIPAAATIGDLRGPLEIRLSGNVSTPVTLTNLRVTRHTLSQQDQSPLCEVSYAER